MENTQQLTKETYRTDHSYMSFSRFSLFLKCEACASARYKKKPTPSLLFGSYVDAYFSNELEEFKSEHPEIFTKYGTLKSDYLKADNIIERIESDELFMHYLSGEKQAIMTGEIEGVKFKIKMDSYLKDECIVDLKVMKDFEKVWNGYYKASFVEAYNYDIELAIFQEIVRQNTGKVLPCYLACVTKEEPSDLGIFNIPQGKLDEALNIVKNNIARIDGILKGKIAPHRCERCEYCRETKKARILDYEYAGAEGDYLRENGIVCDDPLLKKGE